MTHRPGSSLSAQLGLIAVVLVWGINFSVVKDALATLDPLVFNGLRFVTAGVALWALTGGEPDAPPSRPDWIRLVLLGLVGHTAYQLAFIYGLDGTLAGNGAIILASAPIWTVVLSVLSGQEQGRPAIWAATATGAAGVLLVMLGSGREVGLSASHLRGDLLVALSSLCWAIYTVAGKRVVIRLGAMYVTRQALWIGATPLLLMAVPGIRTTDWNAVSPWIWAEVAFSGLGAIALAYVLWYQGVKQLGSAVTALWSNLVPCVALVVAWAWLGEQPSALQILGAAVIVSSVLLTRAATAGGSRKAARPEPLRAGD